MLKLVIDGKEIEVEAGTNLLQACELAGAEIPRFCYHEGLSVAGNCRMCLVQVEKAPKPVASCATPVMDGMVVHTKNTYVQKAREGVMEFLLINHPLDCPICDQGGECDLQDQSYNYGMDASRFKGSKRAVEDKYIGPLVKTIMNRCIHCTRCVRFSAEVAGVEELGAIGRGEDMEITTYLEKSMTSELSGNVIDLCPVGALTSRPYQFKGRPWELQKTETYDVMDAMGLPIRVDTRGKEVLRILPRDNNILEDNWISDKTRFVWDAFKKNRLDTSYIRKNGRMVEEDYYTVLDTVAKKLSSDPQKIGVLVGDLAAVEDIYTLKQILDCAKIYNRDCRRALSVIDNRVQGKAVSRFNTGFDNIYQSDCILLIGGNIRSSAPVLNAMLRKQYSHNNADIALIGQQIDLTYPYIYLGNEANILNDFVSKKHSFFKKLKKASHPMIIIDESVCVGKEGESILAASVEIAMACGAISEEEDAQWCGFNLLSSDIALQGGFEVEFLPKDKGMGTHDILKNCKQGKIDTVFLLGYDNPDFEAHEDVFVIYQGSHGGMGAERADCILPVASYVEKSATYINMEGRVLSAKRASFPLGQAREDWCVMRALADKMGFHMPFNTRGELYTVMAKEYPILAHDSEVIKADIMPLLTWAKQHKKLISDIPLSPFSMQSEDFYLSNIIARNSDVMHECAQIRQKINHNTNEKIQMEPY